MPLTRSFLFTHHLRLACHCAWRLLCLATLSTAAVGTHAQGKLWIVDDDGGVGVDFAALHDGIAAAATGDVILVKAGTYDPPASFLPITIKRKSLTIVGEAGAQPEIGDFVVQNLVAGQSVTLRGLSFDRPVIFEDNNGTVFVEDCEFTVPDFEGTTQPIAVDNCVALHLNRCTSRAGIQISALPSGLTSQSSNVHLYDCTMVGADAYAPVASGGNGVEILGGTLLASNTSFIGGDGECGGNGLHLRGVSPDAKALGGTFTPGVSFDCTFPVSGVRVDAGSHLVLPATPRSFSINGPVQTGASLLLAVQGLPGDFVFLAWSRAPGSRFSANLLGVLQLSIPSLTSSFLGVVGSSGTLQVPITAPALGSEASVLYLQAVAWTSSTGFTLAGASALVITEP